MIGAGDGTREALGGRLHRLSLRIFHTSGVVGGVDMHT